jgi:hypothetical protein
MNLPIELRFRLQEGRGIYVTEACDRCGQLLGPVRFTRAGEPEVWCSRKCRDGVARDCGACRVCGAQLNGKRRGAMYCSDRCRKRDTAQSPGLANYRGMAAENKRVTDAILVSGYGDSRKPENGIIADESGFLAMSKV